MSEFNKVIGYETIKSEMVQICDMFKQRNAYEELGAKIPKGMLLYGEPGLGKTLLAKCFIQETMLPAFTIRKKKKEDEFLNELNNAFMMAMEQAPSIVFLDDMDKYANGDSIHKNSSEYVAIQTWIDESSDKGVFVLATANDIDRLPNSLLRPGRFDIEIEVRQPSEEDAEKIIDYYMSTKKVDEDVDMNDVCKMIEY